MHIWVVLHLLRWQPLALLFRKTKIVVGRSCYHFVHIAVMLELAPLVCWHVWIPITPFQHMIAKPFVGIRSLSVTGIPWPVARQGHAASQSTHEMHSNSASTSTSCVPGSVGGYAPHDNDDDDDDDDDAKSNTALRVRVRV